MKSFTVKVPVSQVSMNRMEENGFEVSDNGRGVDQVFGSLNSLDILGHLTGQQKNVIQCLNMKGMSRKETAQYLGISLQAVHQIVPRIRKRLRDRLNIRYV